MPDPVGQSPDVVREAQQRVVAEAALVAGGCLLLLGVAGDQGGVEVQEQAGQVVPARARRWYAVAGVGGLQPGDVACGGPGFLQGGQCGRTDVGEKTPGGGCGGDRAEHLTLVTQAARSVMVSPPSASITARSTATRPGACPVPRGRSRRNALVKALVSR